MLVSTSIDVIRRKQRVRHGNLFRSAAIHFKYLSLILGTRMPPNQRSRVVLRRREWNCTNHTLNSLFKWIAGHFLHRATRKSKKYSFESLYSQCNDFYCSSLLLCLTKFLFTGKRWYLHGAPQIANLWSWTHPKPSCCSFPRPTRVGKCVILGGRKTRE